MKVPFDARVGQPLPQEQPTTAVSNANRADRRAPQVTTLGSTDNQRHGPNWVKPAIVSTIVLGTGAVVQACATPGSLGEGAYNKLHPAPAPEATATASPTETPTVTDLQAFTQAQIDALTSPTDSAAKQLAINKIQTFMAGNVNPRADIYERESVHLPLHFGVNTDITIPYSGPSKNLVTDSKGFAVIGINCEVTAPDGTVHQVLLTTNDPTFKKGWVKIDTTRLNSNTNGYVENTPGTRDGRGGERYANMLWSQTVGEIIELQFPDVVNPSAISGGVVTVNQIKEYQKLEKYLENQNNPRPTSIVTGNNFSTQPIKYWFVNAYNPDYKPQ